MANEIKQQFADKTKTLIELIKARKKTELQRPQEISEEQKKENVIKWVTFFGRNWNLYAELWLHIKSGTKSSISTYNALYDWYKPSLVCYMLKRFK